MKGGQLALPLGWTSNWSAQSFLVSDANQAAWSWLQSWPERQGEVPLTLLLGPPKSGKSHLAALWVERVGAQDWQTLDLQAAASKPLIADGLGDEPSRAVARINQALALSLPLLITANDVPDPRSQEPKDLASRLARAYAVQIDSPDDALLLGLARKLLADRQLRVDEAVLPYLIKRLPRSYEALWDAVERLDQATMSEGKRLTLPLTRDILAL